MGSTRLHHLYHYLPAFCMKPTLDLRPTHPTILQNTCLNISSFFPSLLNWKAQSWTSYSSVVSSAFIEDDDNFIGFALTTFLVSPGISFIILTERAPLGCTEPGAHHHPSGRTPTPALLSQPVLTHGIVLPRTWISPCCTSGHFCSPVLQFRGLLELIGSHWSEALPLAISDTPRI